jgi:hypothetical protein
MTKCFAVPIIALAVALLCAPRLAAQSGNSQTKTTQDHAQPLWNSVPPLKSAYATWTSKPAPKRDLSGIWDAAEADGGRQVSGNLGHLALYPAGKEMKENRGRRPDEYGGGTLGGHEDETGIAHPLPYTPEGLAALKLNKPSGPGVRQVPIEETNDPLSVCDPSGFPYMEMYELRTIELVQTPKQVIYLNQYYGGRRVIWTDGRELPKDPDPRFYGYSVGHWVDDYTFVVETTGINERTWLDHAGRPHSDQLRVEERFHRVDRDNMQLTVTIHDPKMYSEPWVALDNFPLHRMPDDFDIPEQLCSPVDVAAYNKAVNGATVSGPEKK